ncbi:MAG TPA: L,D-transpeptidase family protein, partial [Candidatus Saccharimonadales bacterium]
TAEELASSRQELEKILNQPVSFTIDQKVVKPSKKDIAAWLELTPDAQEKRVDVDINSGKVLAYINKIAAAHVRSPRDEVVVTNDDGSKTVLVSGINGLDITDKQAIAANVTNSVLDGKGVQASLPVKFKSFDTVSTAAYPKWIEVDITNKRMYAYERTSLVKTFLVSAGAPKTPTVTGKFAIYSKYTQKDMRGLNTDGSRYFQPHVPWVSFFYKDYAIHGNYWRPTSYFGNINSSHGCVSTVPGEAAWMYDWAPIGTPVIIHD